MNPWIGCTKVSPGCKNCYAENYDRRVGGAPIGRRKDPSKPELRWGVGAARTRTSASYWRQPFAWDAAALKAGQRHRVFCASLADVFDDHPSIDSAWRLELFSLIRQTPNLDWLLLTKRPENWRRVLESASSVSARHNGYMASDDDFDATRLWVNQWLGGTPPANVWQGATVEDNERRSRVSDLLRIPAAVRFLSCEPLLEHLVLDGPWPLGAGGNFGIDWVICGGESGPGARPMSIEWARSLRDQCAASGVPFLFKQWGEFSPSGVRVGKKISGRLLDQVQHDGYPRIEARQ